MIDSVFWSVPLMSYCVWLLFGRGGALRRLPQERRGVVTTEVRKPLLRPEETPAGTCSVCGCADGGLVDGYHHKTCLEWLGYTPFVAHRREYEATDREAGFNAFAEAMEAIAKSGTSMNRLRVLPPISALHEEEVVEITTTSGTERYIRVKTGDNSPVTINMGPMNRGKKK